MIKIKFIAELDPINGGSLYTIENGQMKSFKIFNDNKDLIKELRKIADEYSGEEIEVEFVGNQSYATHFAEMTDDIKNVISFVKGF